MAMDMIVGNLWPRGHHGREYDLLLHPAGVHHNALRFHASNYGHHNTLHFAASDAPRRVVPAEIFYRRYFASNRASPVLCVANFVDPVARNSRPRIPVRRA